MGSIFATIASLVIGGLPSIIKAIADEKVNLANATTEQQKILSTEKIKALEAQRDVLVADLNSSPWVNVFRASILFPFSFYIMWTVAWDKIACKWFFNEGSCTTDALSQWQFQILAVGLAYLFLTDVTKIFRK